jgi:hypothetical protein
MKPTTPTNLTKHGHVLHSFTEDDCVIGLDKEGNPFRAPMHYEGHLKKICYTILDMVFDLPSHLQVRLSIIK